MKLPSGTITFLFTDIEGSTRMWEDHPEQMLRALARHDEIMRGAVHQNDGAVFKTVGDACCAAFHTAPDAARAAFEAQVALSSEDWPEPLAIRVRMAVHTGAAEVRDSDYFGPPLNRVARILSTAHGGQIVFSDVSHDLCLDALPSGCSLRSLGEHRLRDLGRPERVYQLCHPGLSSDFPALRSLENLPNNLPQQLTSFVGRESEAARVRELMGKARLVTLTGSGGCGKTRLSLQVAAEVLDAYPDGGWLVELAPVSDPDLVPRTVAGVLGLKDQAGAVALQSVKEYLKDRHIVLILDNCEHLLDACARLADEILRHCPGVSILASSREGLGIDGEVTYRVPSLALPTNNQPESAESLAQYESVRLFIDRALSHNPSFAVTNQNAPAVASVCQRLDGIPLAIELAAARLRSMSVEEVNQRLDQRFRLLTGGSRTALPRQQTLRSLIDWSYALLNDQDKALLRRLSVFMGGWTLEAAESVCAGPPLEDWEILDRLSSLIDKSLVFAEEREGVTRYQLLETVRQYARDRMVESEDAEQWRDAHLAFFARWIHDTSARFTTDTTPSLDAADRERANLRSALAWALERPGGTRQGLEMVADLYWFWYVRGYGREGLEWVERYAAIDPSAVDSYQRHRLMRGGAMLSSELGDYPRALALLDESLELTRALGNRRAEAKSYETLGCILAEQSKFAEARRAFEKELELYRAEGVDFGVPSALINLAEMNQRLGDLESAESLFQEALSKFRAQGRLRGVAYTTNLMGEGASLKGDHAAARELFAQSLALYRSLGDRRGTADCLANFGYTLLEDGDPEGARELFVEGYAIFGEIGVRKGLARCLEGLAQASAESEPLLAARYWGAAERLREEIGAPLPEAVRARYERAVASSRASAGAPFEDSWAEGRSLPADQALELATSPQS